MSIQLTNDVVFFLSGFGSLEAEINQKTLSATQNDDVWGLFWAPTRCVSVSVPITCSGGQIRSCLSPPLSSQPTATTTSIVELDSRPTNNIERLFKHMLCACRRERASATFDDHDDHDGQQNPLPVHSCSPAAILQPHAGLRFSIWSPVSAPPGWRPTLIRPMICLQRRSRLRARSRSNQQATTSLSYPHK